MTTIAELKALIDEIDALKAELASRRAEPRPLPASVESAYRIAIDRLYVRLASAEANEAQPNRPQTA